MIVLPPELWEGIMAYLPDSAPPRRRGGVRVGFSHRAMLCLLSECVCAPKKSVSGIARSNYQERYEDEHRPGDMDTPHMEIRRLKCVPGDYRMDIQFSHYSQVEFMSAAGALFAHVDGITLSHCDITNADALRGIRTVTLAHCARLVDVSALENCAWLAIESCPLIADFSCLARVPDLTLQDVGIKRLFETENENLTLIECSDLTDISGLRRVRSLSLESCGNVACLRPLSQVTERLEINGNLSAGLPNLRACRVVLWDCNIADVTPLRNVERVELHNCCNVTDISALGSAKHVLLTNCDGIKDISPVRHADVLTLYNIAADCGCLGGRRHLRVSMMDTAQTDYAQLGNCYTLEIYRSSWREPDEAKGFAEEARRLAPRIRHCYHR